MATAVSLSDQSSVSQGVTNTDFQQKNGQPLSSNSQKGETTDGDLQSSFFTDFSFPSQFPMQQATQKLESVVTLSATPILTTSFTSVSDGSDTKTDFVTEDLKSLTITDTNDVNTDTDKIEISKTNPSKIDVSLTQTLTKFGSSTSETQQKWTSPGPLNLKQNISSSSTDSLLKSDTKVVFVSKSTSDKDSDATSYGETSTRSSESRSISLTDVNDIGHIYSSTLGKTNYSAEISQTDSATDFVVPSVTPDIKISPKVSMEISGSGFYSHFHLHSKGFPEYKDLSGETIQTILPTATMTTSSTPVIGPKISSSIPPPPAVLPTGPPSTPSGSPNGTNVSSTVTPASLFANYPLVIGVALCGAGIVILLLVLIVICCRKKKPNKEKHGAAQDLWVNTQGEIPLTPGLDTVPTFESVSEPGFGGNKAKTNGNKPGSDICHYKVIHPFKPTIEGQMEIERGDVVTVIQKDANGWWKGAVGDRVGWFPGSFVKEIEIVAGKNKEKDSKDKEPTAVSSFLLSKDKKRAPPVPTRGDYNVNRYSDSRLPQKLALGKEVPIPKVPETSLQTDKQNNEVKIDLEVPATKPEAFDYNIEGKKFKALYSYVSNFKEELDMVAGEIITGIEKDRNGWMKGRKKTGDEGWVPSVYMEEIAASPRHTNQIYDQLYCNRGTDNSQDLLGIVHTASCPYAAERPEDLSFDTGDTIVVFDTLENGWWLGCRGDDVGWFPGSYVELVEEEVPEVVVVNPTIDKNTKPIVTNSTFEDQPLKSDSTISDKNFPISPLKSDVSELSAYKSDDEHSVSSGSTIESKRSPGSKPKPARKAPAPPSGDSVKGSRIPRFGNTTPNSNNKKEQLPVSPIDTTLSTSTVDSESVFSVSELSRSELNNTSKTFDSPVPSDRTGQFGKPELPKRYIKPKLLKIPRKPDNMRYITERSSQKTKSPPPPRPDPPKYLPRNSGAKVEKQDTNTTGLNDNEVSTVKVEMEPRLDELKIRSVEPKPRSKIPKISREDSADTPNVQINFVENKTDRKVKDAYMESFGDDSFNISGVTSLSSDVSYSNDENKGKVCSSFKTPPKENKHMLSKEIQINVQSEFTDTSRTVNENLNEGKQIFDGQGIDISRDNVTKSENVTKTESVMDNFETSAVDSNLPKIPKASRIPKFPQQISQPSHSENSEFVDSPQNQESHIPQRQTRIPSISKHKTDLSDPSIESNQLVSTSQPEVETDKVRSEGQDPLPSPKKISKIPQSPKQSRLPMLNKEKKRDKSLDKLEDRPHHMSREGSPSTQKPPVAPKPKMIPVPKVYHKGASEHKPEYSDSHLDSSADELDDIDGNVDSKFSNNADELDMDENVDSKFSKNTNVAMDTEIYAPEKRENFPENVPDISNVEESPITAPKEVKRSIPVLSKSAKKSPTLKNKTSQIPLSPGKKPVAKKRNKNSPSNREPSPATKAEESMNGKTSRSSSLSDDGSSKKSKPKRPDKPPSRSGSQSDDGGKIKPDRPDKPPEGFKSKIPSKPKTTEQSPSRIPTLPSLPGSSSKGQGQNVSPERNSRSRVKGRSAIPMMKPARPPPPRSPSPEPVNANEDVVAMETDGTIDRLPQVKKTLRRAIKNYDAQNDDELSFEVGSFIKEIEDCEDNEKTKWRVGMLADGTIGLFHISFVEDAPA